jgi:hypothetical protein
LGIDFEPNRASICGQMPRATSLALYAVKIWNLQDKEDEQISDFADGSDFFDFTKTFLAAIKAVTAHDKAVQQVFRVKKLSEEQRRLFGVIETGEYGVESTLWDVETSAVAHRRKKTEADMLPFYFLFDIPDGTDEGLLLLQRSGNLGIRKALHVLMKQRFEAEFDDLRLRIDPLVEEKEIEKYAKGRIEKIRFIRFGIPSDLTDSFDTGHEETEGFVELVIRARRGKSLPINNRLRQFRKKERTLGNLFALTESKFTYEDIKVNSRVGNSTRTIDLARPDHLRSYHDISSEVKLDTNGHPKFESIHELAEALADKTRERLYVGGGR